MRCSNLSEGELLDSPGTRAMKETLEPIVTKFVQDHPAPPPHPVPIYERSP
jgi:hypothetical protein